MRHVRYTDYTDDTRVLDAYVHQLRKLEYDFIPVAIGAFCAALTAPGECRWAKRGGQAITPMHTA